MSYYRTNAIYESLCKEEGHRFFWVSGNAWMLLYGSSDAEVKAIVFVSGRSWKPRGDIISLIESISHNSGVPLLFVNFDDSAKEIEGVEFRKIGQDFTSLSLEELRDEFSSVGLPVKGGMCGKCVNDSTSSAYHKWQRENLGSSITVSDIDLIRVGENGDPIEAIELKRSFFPLNRWRPYPDDFPNFNVVLSLCEKAEMRFTIAYNVRETKPSFFDDPSRISIFSYPRRNYPIMVGEVSLQEFVEGFY